MTIKEFEQLITDYENKTVNTIKIKSSCGLFQLEIGNSTVKTIGTMEDLAQKIQQQLQTKDTNQ
jgi:hypothetical protein